MTSITPRLKIISTTAATLMLLVLFTCSKRIDQEPAPDLVIDSVQQNPNPMIAGTEGSLLVTVSNRGDAPARKTILRIWRRRRHIIAEKSVPKLYPKVKKTYKIALPPSELSYTVRVVVYSKKVARTAKQTENEAFVEIRVITLTQSKSAEQQREKDFAEIARKNLIDHCRGELRLIRFQRTDRMTNYHLAKSGDVIPLIAEIRNYCDSPIKNVTIRWIAVDADYLSSGSQTFGISKINIIRPNEKRIFMQKWQAGEGKFKLGLSLRPEGLMPGESELLKPFLIISTEPQQ